MLTTILGHSEMAADLLPEDPLVREDLSQIKRASELAASLTKQFLAFSRKQVIEPAAAEDALTIEASAQFPIDLLLTDVVMPGMSGPKLVAALKPKRPDMRVLLMSGYPGDDLTGELKPDEPFLRKPFTPYILLEHIRAVLDPSNGPPTRRPGN